MAYSIKMSMTLLIVTLGLTVTVTVAFKGGNASDFAPPIQISANGYCGAGERFVLGVDKSYAQCLPCAKGTFQDAYKHRNTNCKKCRIFDEYNVLMILTAECSRFHDIDYECLPTHFLERRACSLCSNCTKEKTELVPCGKHNDTQCGCPKGMVLKSGECVMEYKVHPVTVTPNKEERPTIQGSGQDTRPGHEGSTNQDKTEDSGAAAHLSTVLKVAVSLATFLLLGHLFV